MIKQKLNSKNILGLIHGKGLFKSAKKNRIGMSLVDAVKLRFYTIGLLLLTIMLINGCFGKKKQVSSESSVPILNVYTHSALSALVDKTIPIFEEKYRCRVFVEYTSEVSDMVSRLIDEKENPNADIVLGIDNGSYIWMIDNELVIPYKPENIDNIDKKYQFDSSNHFTPFCFGYYAFVYDSYIVNQTPQTFGKMQDGAWKNTFLISDARTSTNGLGFLLWSVALFGENGFAHFWRSIKNNVFFTAPLWDQSLGMFLAGEAPIMLGFSTLPAYFVEVEKDSRYKSFIPEEGAYMYIESAAIVRGTGNTQLAKHFIDFVVSREFQRNVASTRWLYPVIERMPLPAAFNDIAIPTTVLNNNISRNFNSHRIGTWVERWSQVMID